LAAGVINTGFANNVADYMAQEGVKHTELQRELCECALISYNHFLTCPGLIDPNMNEIMEMRAKAIYGGQRAEVTAWSAEQVEVMVRRRVPAYYISGG
jgi:hypothetical protein